MNTLDILKYGHQSVRHAVDDLPEQEWYTPGVVGAWSTKDVIAHLVSFEQLLVDVLLSLLDNTPIPTLERYKSSSERFNEIEVAARRDRTVADLLHEYESCHAQAVALTAQISIERRRQNGLLPWYGEEYDLEDFIVYAIYGHKREHCAQIGLFRDRLSQALETTSE